MKKFLGVLVILLCILLSAPLVMADDTTCVTGPIDDNGVITYSWKLRDTDSDGIVTGNYCTRIANGWVYGVRFIPDDTGNLVISGDYQPSNNWDGKIQDQYGYDVLDDVGRDVTYALYCDESNCSDSVDNDTDTYTDEGTRQYRTPITTDSSGNNVGMIYLSGVKLRAYASGLGSNNGCKIEIYIKVADAAQGRHK